MLTKEPDAFVIAEYIKSDAIDSLPKHFKNATFIALIDSELSSIYTLLQEGYRDYLFTVDLKTEFQELETVYST